MNVDNDRKAFEEWAKWNGFQLILDKDGNGDYKHDLAFYSFEAWLASANRQGYKLVPVCKHEWSIQLSGRFICDLCGEFMDEKP